MKHVIRAGQRDSVTVRWNRLLRVEKRAQTQKECVSARR